MTLIEVLESVSGIFLSQMDVPNQVWHMIKIMGGDFSEQYQSQVPKKTQLETIIMVSHIAEQIGMNYPEVPDSRYVAQSVIDFFFAWEEEGSVENLITTEEDEGLSEPKIPVSEPASEPMAMVARTALPSIENF